MLPCFKMQQPVSYQQAVISDQNPNTIRIIYHFGFSSISLRLDEDVSNTVNLSELLTVQRRDKLALTG